MKINRLPIGRMDYQVSSLTADLLVWSTPEQSRGYANHSQRHTEQVTVRSEEEGPPFLGPIIKFKPINTVSKRPSNPGGSGFGRYRKYGILGFCLGSPTHPQEQLCHSSLRALGLWWSHGLLWLKSQSKTEAGAINCRPGPRTVLAKQWVNIEFMVSYQTSL